MSKVSGTARLDARGRLVLPAALRHRLCMRAGDEVVVREEADGVLHVESRRAAARRLVGSAGSVEHSTIEELRAERGREAMAEDTSAQRGPQ